MKTSLVFLLSVSLLAVALLGGGADAFAPSSQSRTAAFVVTKTATPGPRTALNAEGGDEASSASEGGGGEILLDSDFEDLNLVRLMGLKRLKKMARRHRRELNDRIRNFEVVQNSEGEWIPATAEQTAEMRKSAAGVSTTPAPAPSTPAEDGGGRKKGGKEPLKLIIAGAPASGKGTQCEVIREKYGVVHLSTGDMLRAAVAEGTEVGRAAKDYMDAGRLVPDEVIIGVVKDRLSQSDCLTSGWLLDGFPRTPAQAAALSDAGVTADCFIFLEVPDSDLIERVCGRRTDPATGKIYHMTFSPPEGEDREEVLGRLQQRSDDTEEKVKVRLEQFHANVDAVKGSYEDIGVEIDGSKKPEEVSEAIAQAVRAKIGA